MLCSKCKNDLPTSHFSPRKDRKRGYAYKCKSCINKIRSARKFTPVTEGVKTCNKCNVEKHVTEFFVSRKITDGREGHCKACEYKRKMRNLNTRKEVRVVENLRRRTRAVLEGTNKSASTLELIGCSPLELRSHLETQFTEGMSWDNYGKWHVDHIKPCCSFDLTDSRQQKECFNYTNLQPLWAEDNLRKGTS